MTMSNVGPFGDTTHTKVFVGGLAWETQKDALREHFDKFGEILEAVIISDKVTGRSKGYGFVTFKEADSAKKACEESTPVINGRRANCNLASLGARRPRSSPAVQPVPTVGSRSVSSARASPVQWYYPAGTPPSPYHPHHHQGIPFQAYGYIPAYVADVSYNTKLSYTGGTYLNGQFSQVYQGQGPPTTVMQVYPFYHYHQPHTMGIPAHIYPPTTASPVTSIPTIITKPASMAPNPVCLSVEQVSGCS